MTIRSVVIRALGGCCLVLGLTSATARPQPPMPPPPLPIPRIDASIHVDGVLDEPAWQQAAVLEVPFEIQPGDNSPAPVRTECRLAYNENHLFVGFRVYDDHPDQIRAHLTDRDQCFRDDFVGVMIDPFNDERRGFEFFVNPLGVQMDLAVNDLSIDSNEDETWDGIWDSAGRITAEGYIVEMAIPFTTLRFPRTLGAQTWGLIADRNYPRDIRHIFFSVPLDRDRMGMLCQAGKVTGMAGIRPGRSLEFDPTVTAHRTDRRAAPLEADPDPFGFGAMANGKLRGDVGLSARWGITPNLSLNAAVNPDFSQVEADAVQLAINTRYALSYAEKRPFFMEAADFFATGLPAVYTRAVADPDWGVKLTGKEGAHAVGLFVARDARPNLIFPSNLGSNNGTLDAPATTAVARYRRDFGRAVTIGGLLTTREGKDYFNHLGGIDGHVRFGRGDLLRFQALGTSTHYPDSTAASFGQPARSFDGFGAVATLIHSRRAWTGWAEYEHKDPGFRADAGFIPRVDTRSAAAGLERHFYGEAGRWYTRLNFELNGSFTVDHDGRRTDQAVNIEAFYQGPFQSSVEMDLSRLDERYIDRTYPRKYGSIHAEIQPHKNLKLWYTQRGGDAIDYENGRGGVIFATGPGGQIDIGRHLHVFADETYERFRAGGGELYTTNVLDTRMVYQLNARAFLRALVQYVTIDRTAPLYGFPVLPHERELLTQLLASYKINPQTVFYLGCTDDHSGPSARRMLGIERTVFVKLGYAWLV